MDELLDVQRLLSLGRNERIGVALDAVTAHGLDRVRAAAVEACDDVESQVVGVLILGALGIDDDPSCDALVEAAAELAGSSDIVLREAVAEALGLCSTDGRTRWLLVALADDEDPTVRLTAVQGLCVSADDEPDDGGEVTALLLRKFDDPVPEVRDYAVFALGVTRDVDSLELRDAFLRLLEDEEADTAGEAAVALGRRGDVRVLPRLLEQLSEPDVGNLWVEAAAELADPSALPALLRLRDEDWGTDDPRPQVLVEAINRCSGQPASD